MLWLYVLLTTAGLVCIVPTVLRAIDGMPANLPLGFTGFVGTVGGLTGLFCRQANVGGWATFIVASALGLAAGALHPELLTLLREKPERPLPHGEPTETSTKAAAE